MFTVLRKFFCPLGCGGVCVK
ncbi:hypothetical protein ACQ27_gp408 [Klebsiella phage K64-1]|nr:hypothetical protein ACQ27_gp408 [Klebsiella phage K64-1]